MTHIIVDASNLFHRARHVVRGDDIETKIGMAMHIMFSSVNKVWRDFNGTHVVFCFDGYGWRREEYEPYKAQRREKRKTLSESEQQENLRYNRAFNDLVVFLYEETNVTVLEEEICEADDFIARWIQHHPDEDHVIISSDSDFYQLLSDNVSQYNGISNQHITINGVFDDRGRPVIDPKTKEHKQIGDPEWLLFEKCIRGDTSDNIFSAYPGARKKGTKNKVGMLEAFADRNQKGFAWNNFMLQRWVDHNGDEHVVRDDYLRNKKLIDLTQQPEDVSEVMDNAIVEAVTKMRKSQVGVNFMKFCGKYNLVRLGEQSADHARYLGAAYLDKVTSN